jgi:hypothetical protein
LPKLHNCLRGATRFYRVREIVSLFVQMGCEIREAEKPVYLEDGDSFGFRYFVNIETGAFQPIVDLADEDFISEGEVTAWERRLGIIIPKGE